MSDGADQLGRPVHGHAHVLSGRAELGGAPPVLVGHERGVARRPAAGDCGRGGTGGVLGRGANVGAGSAVYAGVRLGQHGHQHEDDGGRRRLEPELGHSCLYLPLFLPLEVFLQVILAGCLFLLLVFPL